VASFEFEKHVHRRLNPLTGDWVLVSPGRTRRPWQGQVEPPPQQVVPAYDSACYMCPGNARAAGERNPAYTETFVFENDFPALTSDAPAGEQNTSGLMVARTERGACRVICFSPRHDLTFARMSPAEIRAVVDIWARQYTLLGEELWINHVLIFENRGAMMGASNPHPHGQIWANATVPNEPAKEEASFLAFQKRRAACLLCKYLEVEAKTGERIVCENEDFVVLVPFWAEWPFETLLLSKRHLRSIDELSDSARNSLGDILKRLNTRYDNLFECPFPYSMGFHQRPTDGQPHAEWHFHAHFYPPLLRTATVRKFSVGYEMLASPQRDFTPEEAAAHLREVPEQHYSEKSR
jgi:UDPglucose--hexose-1-phosphate uridylyltransferase